MEEQNPCTARERLKNARNQDMAADRVQEKAQINTGIETERQHTYLG